VLASDVQQAGRFRVGVEDVARVVGEHARERQVGEQHLQVAPPPLVSLAQRRDLGGLVDQRLVRGAKLLERGAQLFERVAHDRRRRRFVRAPLERRQAAQRGRGSQREIV
jgi:hypothetical protein